MNHISRKYFWLLITMVLFVVGSCKISLATPQAVSSTSVQKQFADLEASSGGHLGIAAINTADNSRIDYHAEERFPFQSTVKVIVVAAILKQSMSHPHLLKQRVFYQKSDLMSWSPITAKHLKDGRTISELCAAAIMFSDNTAANLLIKKLGGPQAVTTFARSIGNDMFRFEDYEENLNSTPGDPRDTSTPAAMEKSLQKLALGNVLGASQQKQLVTWMKNNTTGNTRIRVGVPMGWIVADKTGAGEYGITNDIGLLWSPEGAPIVMALYFIQNKKEAPRRDDVIASATRILVHEFSKN